MKRSEYRKKQSSSRKKTILKVIGVLVAAFLILAGTYAVYLYRQAQIAADGAFESIDRDGSKLRDEKVEPYEDNVSILFIGVDDSEVRNESHSRSDAVMLATLNNDDKSVKLVSIPRDSLVYIPEVGYQDKITHAHAFGGPEATIETVEELLNVPVDYYVKMNFHAFIDVVDALGGITVDVPYERLEKDENDQYTIQLEPGVQELDGRHALALARTRMLDNDVERGKRQQMILEALMDKASSVSSISRYGDVIKAIGDNMTTDLSFNDMKALAAYLQDGKLVIESITLEGYDDMTTGAYYWRLDEEKLEETSQLLRSHLGLEQPGTEDGSEDGSEAGGAST
ncbi:Putative transcriptional regulator ywtF [Bhargavaea cecembensis DSE10]|uniref:Putative transcriptional regulator ywtF n=1 Tax=Bhargavaea cecembensis DSE10 TaxID=1235279 RepID=M7NLF1_9BACL|nr:LCP family protein [Bhargavaea cecembensis]EMR07961.1 Putative transcriptional regulator ywtF [Bhargavaea cecembensis DSE10]